MTTIERVQASLLLLLLVAITSTSAFRSSRTSAAFTLPRPRSSSPSSALPLPIQSHTLTPSRHALTTPRPQANRRPFPTSLHALPSVLLQDLSGATLVGIASAVWLKLWTTLATSGKVDSKDSRKLIHCGSGPLFMLCWPFFSADPTARFYAAAVPFLQAIAVVASGLAKQQPEDQTLASPPTIKKKPSGLVAAISRSGNPAEVLRGPLLYVIILLLSTLCFWRESVVGLVAVSQMAAGDGMADIVGRRWGGKKWPFSSTKSYAGTGAFVVSGFLVSVGLIAWFHFWGLVPALTLGVVGRVGVISVLCAIVELVPWGDDNVNVPVVASALATALLL